MATLEEYQSQETINSSKQGTESRSLGAVPIQDTKHIDNDHSLNGWLITGIVSAVVIVAVITGLATALFIKTRKSSKS